jgi:serine protease AprX
MGCNEMQKKTGKPLKKIAPGLQIISCALILLISLFSFMALAENTSISDTISTNDKISAILSTKITKVPATELIPVIVKLKNQNIPFNNANGRKQTDHEQRNLISFLNDAKSNNKAQKIKPIHVVNAVAAEVTPEIIASLATRPEVSSIEPDNIVSTADGQELPLIATKLPRTKQNDTWGVDKIGAPAVWQQDITGKGITVAIVDTGIDAKHPDLDDLDDKPSTNDPKVVGWIDYVNKATSPYDDNGHGTHTAGIISGTGAKGIHTGVAPGTNLIVAKVFDSYGAGHESDIILAFEWAVDKGARIISFNAGEPHNDSFTIAVDNVVSAGVIPVIAAGNEGPTHNTIECPGDEINSTTVGATDSTDKIASFSSCGPVVLYGQSFIKPDVTAPGVSVTSTYPGGGYAVMSGTSMAAPHVSGTVALMLQKNPALNPSEVKKILESTAVDLGKAGRDNTYGSGRIDAYKAVSLNPPLADFYASPTSGRKPLKIAFQDESSGTVTSWYWTFGDGTSSKTQNPVHKYTAVGMYNVGLTVGNAAGSNIKRCLIILR